MFTRHLTARASGRGGGARPTSGLQALAEVDEGDDDEPRKAVKGDLYGDSDDEEEKKEGAGDAAG